MKTLPTLSQIEHIRFLLRSELYDISVVARLTGISLRDVFRIEKAMMKELKP